MKIIFNFSSSSPTLISYNMKSTLGVKMFLAKYVLFIIGLQIEALFPATIFQGYLAEVHQSKS